MENSNSLFLTDLYQLKMAAGYFETKQHETEVVFEGFVRKLPNSRNFLVMTGLSLCLDYLKNLTVTDEEIYFIKNHPDFLNVSPEFFEYLRNMRFTCDVNAVPEGTILFANEPFIQVKGPIIQAQIVETILLSFINGSTSVSSKAARIYIAAEGSELAEFGFRRAHGPEAAVHASRAAFISGFSSTSNVFAAMKYGIKLAGTMAHSWIMFHDKEAIAFDNFRKVFPTSTSTLIDTFNPISGTERAILVVKEQLKSVRLDSGDKIYLSKFIRRLLDNAGLKDTKIFVSDDMNEYKINTLKTYNCPIDYFGVGTEVVTSKDQPALGGVYKLTEIHRNGTVEYKAKGSEGKVTLPGMKQIYRQYDEAGLVKRDILALTTESPVAGTPLIQNVMKAGVVTYNETVLQMQARFFSELKTLPKKFRSIDNVFTYEIEYSDTIAEILETILSENEVIKQQIV